MSHLNGFPHITVYTHIPAVNSDKKSPVDCVHQHIKVIDHSESILVTLYWCLPVNELVSSDIKIKDCSKKDNVVFSFSRSHKCGRLITFC